MTDLNIILTFIVFIGVFITFVREQYAPHMVAMVGMAVLLATGAISSNDMLHVFSNSAPITIACMFIISSALDRTGVIDSMGAVLLKKLSGSTEMKSVFIMMIIVIFCSAFMNNTPVVVIMTPIIITLAEKLKHYPSKYLIPLSYAAIMGGTCTLIGTSTNILVDGVAQKYGQAAFSMFEISLVGVCMALAGTIFLTLFGRFLLPNRMPPKDEIEDPALRKKFVTEAIITVDSPLIGQTLNELKFTESESYEIIDLVRREQGNRMGMSDAISAFIASLKTAPQETSTDKPRKVSPLRDIPLEAGDRLVFKVDKDELIELKKHIGVVFDPEKAAHISESMPTRSVIVAEGFLPAASDMIGKRIRDLRLRRRYGCFVIGLHRRDTNLTGDIGNTVLRENDTLILEGPEDELERLFDNENILSGSQMRARPFDKRLAPIAIGMMIGVIVLSALDFMPIAGLAFIGAMAVIVTKCLTPEQAYRSIDWRILMLIFGMLGIGTAMENTGAMELLTNQIVNFSQSLSPIVILAIVYALTSILTEFMTNNAVAIVMTPIVIGMATTLGLDPRPFVVAIMLGASASFATPIGYQTNTFVYAAGGYKFKDFVRIGVPMNLIMWLVAVTLIPMFWSF